MIHKPKHRHYGDEVEEIEDDEIEWGMYPLPSEHSIEINPNKPFYLAIVKIETLPDKQVAHVKYPKWSSGDIQGFTIETDLPENLPEGHPSALDFAFYDLYEVVREFPETIVQLIASSPYGPGHATVPFRRLLDAHNKIEKWYVFNEEGKEIVSNPSLDSLDSNFVRRVFETHNLMIDLSNVDFDYGSDRIVVSDFQLPSLISRGMGYDKEESFDKIAKSLGAEYWDYRKGKIIFYFPSFTENPKKELEPFYSDRTGEEFYDLGLRSPDAFQSIHSLTIKIISLEPSEFYRFSAKAKGTPLVLEWSRINNNLVDRYMHHMSSGYKFEIPYIDFHTKKSGGGNTVMAAKKLQVSKIPVVIIMPVDMSWDEIRK